MTLDHDRPYFNQSIAACRRAGGIGGHHSARNRRLRQTGQLRVTRENVEVRPKTGAEAIALLDAQFPWLRGAERRTSRLRGGVRVWPHCAPRARQGARTSPWATIHATGGQTPINGAPGGR